MWLSKPRTARQRGGLSVGEVSIADGSPAVVTDTEHRALPICSPGGVYWVPSAGEELVVAPLDAGRCVLGRITDPPEDMESGELCFSVGSAKIKLKSGGIIEIDGDVAVNGTLRLNGQSMEGDSDGAEA